MAKFLNQSIPGNTDFKGDILPAGKKEIAGI